MDNTELKVASMLLKKVSDRFAEQAAKPIFTNTQLRRTEAKIEGPKRAAAPYAVTATCTWCQFEQTYDLADRYFSYLTWGETDVVNMHCEGCDLEQDCRVQLDLAVELEEG